MHGIVDIVEELCSSVEKIRRQNGLPFLRTHFSAPMERHFSATYILTCFDGFSCKLMASDWTLPLQNTASWGCLCFRSWRLGDFLSLFSNCHLPSLFSKWFMGKRWQDNYWSNNYGKLIPLIDNCLQQWWPLVNLMVSTIINYCNNPIYEASSKKLMSSVGNAKNAHPNPV